MMVGESETVRHELPEEDALAEYVVESQCDVVRHAVPDVVPDPHGEVETVGDADVVTEVLYDAPAVMIVPDGETVYVSLGCGL